MDDEAYAISSELYEEFDYRSSEQHPTVSAKNVVSRFTFKQPDSVKADKDGDLEVPRRNSNSSEYVLEIEHSESTILDLVGLQIWRGSLLFADWLLEFGKELPKDGFILELGTGVGLTSIVASMFCPVICTDIDRGDIFKIIKANIDRNKHLVKHPIEVTELDFTSDSLPARILELLPKISLIIAADVIYDDTLTDAFVKTVKNLLSIPPKRSIYIALEKRYVFTISDCDTSAPCYDYFLEQLEKLENCQKEEIQINFCQYFQYDRVKELVLWKISSKF